MDMENWTSRLKSELGKRKISMRAFSKEIGQSPDYLKKTLRQGSEPSVATFLKMAEVLNVSVFWLWYGEPVQKEDEELVRSFARLSKKDKNIVKASVVAALESPDD